MSEWNMVKLGEVCKIARGGSPRPIDKFITNEPDGINWIKIGDTRLDSKYITKTKEKIKVEGLQKSRFVEKGDFLLSNSMSFGRPYILKINGCIHDGWLVLKDTENVFSKDFLYYSLSSETMFRKFKSLAAGCVVNNLNSEMVRNVFVPLPPLEKQQEIAEELDNITELIALRKQQLEKLDLLVKAKFVEMFGDPVENPMGWEVGTINSLCTAIYGGGTPSKSKEEYYTGNIPWVTPKDMKFDYIYDSRDHISEEAIENSSTKYIPVDSVLMVIRSGILKHTLPVAINKVPVTVNQDMKVYIPNTQKTNSFFLLYTFKMWEKDLLTNVRAVTADNIEFNVIKNLNTILPPLPLQEQFAHYVQAVEETRNKMEQGQEKLEQLYRERMQRWFGE